eukprot:ANDGO_05535.mRNA.1 Inositol 1
MTENHTALRSEDVVNLCLNLNTSSRNCDGVLALRQKVVCAEMRSAEKFRESALSYLDSLWKIEVINEKEPADAPSVSANPTIRYGDSVRLIHHIRERALCLSRDCADDKTGQLLPFVEDNESASSSKNSASCVWVVQPGFRTRTVGDAVMPNDAVVLFHPFTQYYIIFPEVYDAIRDGCCPKLVGSPLPRCSWRIVFHSTNAHSRWTMGQVSKIVHCESKRVLCTTPQILEERVSDGQNASHQDGVKIGNSLLNPFTSVSNLISDSLCYRHRVASDSMDNPLFSSQLWIIEPLDPLRTGTDIRFGDEVRFRHLPTQTWLSLDKSQSVFAPEDRDELNITVLETGGARGTGGTGGTGDTGGTGGNGAVEEKKSILSLLKLFRSATAAQESAEAGGKAAGSSNVSVPQSRPLYLTPETGDVFVISPLELLSSVPLMHSSYFCIVHKKSGRSLCMSVNGVPVLRHERDISNAYRFSSVDSSSLSALVDAVNALDVLLDGSMAAWNSFIFASKLEQNSFVSLHGLQYILWKLRKIRHDIDDDSDSDAEDTESANPLSTSSATKTPKNVRHCPALQSLLRFLRLVCEDNEDACSSLDSSAISLIMSFAREFSFEYSRTAVEALTTIFLSSFFQRNSLDSDDFVDFFELYSAAAELPSFRILLLNLLSALCFNCPRNRAAIGLVLPKSICHVYSISELDRSVTVLQIGSSSPRLPFASALQRGETEPLHLAFLRFAIVLCDSEQTREKKGFVQPVLQQCLPLFLITRVIAEAPTHVELRISLLRLIRLLYVEYDAMHFSVEFVRPILASGSADASAGFTSESPNDSRVTELMHTSGTMQKAGEEGFLALRNLLKTLVSDPNISYQLLHEILQVVASYIRFRTFENRTFPAPEVRDMFVPLFSILVTFCDIPIAAEAGGAKDEASRLSLNMRRRTAQSAQETELRTTKIPLSILEILQIAQQVFLDRRLGMLHNMYERSSSEDVFSSSAEVFEVSLSALLEEYELREAFKSVMVHLFSTDTNAHDIGALALHIMDHEERLEHVTLAYFFSCRVVSLAVRNVNLSEIKSFVWSNLKSLSLVLLSPAILIDNLSLVALPALDALCLVLDSSYAPIAREYMCVWDLPAALLPIFTPLFTSQYAENLREVYVRAYDLVTKFVSGHGDAASRIVARAPIYRDSTRRLVKYYPKEVTNLWSQAVVANPQAVWSFILDEASIKEICASPIQQIAAFLVSLTTHEETPKWYFTVALRSLLECNASMDSFKKGFAPTSILEPVVVGVLAALSSCRDPVVERTCRSLIPLKVLRSHVDESVEYMTFFVNLFLRSMFGDDLSESAECSLLPAIFRFLSEKVQAVLSDHGRLESEKLELFRNVYLSPFIAFLESLFAAGDRANVPQWMEIVRMEICASFSLWNTVSGQFSSQLLKERITYLFTLNQQIEERNNKVSLKDRLKNSVSRHKSTASGKAFAASDAMSDADHEDVPMLDVESEGSDMTDASSEGTTNSSNGDEIVEDAFKVFQRDVLSEFSSALDEQRENRHIFLQNLPTETLRRFLNFIGSSPEWFTSSEKQMWIRYWLSLIRDFSGRSMDNQSRLDDAGATIRILETLRDSRLLPRADRLLYQAEALQTLMFLAKNGNTSVQRTILNFVETVDGFLIDLLLEVLRNAKFGQHASDASLEVLLASPNPFKEHVTSFIDKPFDDGLPSAERSFVSVTEPLMIVLGLIQQLCEGHNLRAQIALGSLVEPLLQLFLLFFRPDRLTSRLPTVWTQVLRTLSELVQGPCAQNQTAFLLFVTKHDVLQQIASFRPRILEILADRMPEKSLKKYHKKYVRINNKKLRTNALDEFGDAGDGVFERDDDEEDDDGFEAAWVVPMLASTKNEWQFLSEFVTLIRSLLEGGQYLQQINALSLILLPSYWLVQSLRMYFLYRHLRRGDPVSAENLLVNCIAPCYLLYRSISLSSDQARIPPLDRYIGCVEITYPDGFVGPYTYLKPIWNVQLRSADRKLVVFNVDRSSPIDKVSSLVETSKEWSPILKTREKIFKANPLAPHSRQIFSVLRIITNLLIILFNVGVVINWPFTLEEKSTGVVALSSICVALLVCRVGHFFILDFADYVSKPWRGLVPFSYLLFLVAMNVLALTVHKFFYAALLVDLVLQSEIMRSVFMSITKNGIAILLTLLFIVIVLYFFSLYAFATVSDRFVDADGNSTCTSVPRCFANLLTSFPSNGDKVSSVMDLARRPSNFIFFVLFWLCIMVFLLNILFGLIVDAFGSEREAKQEVVDDCYERCFICAIESARLDRERQPIGFRGHIKQEHNMWDYFFLVAQVLDKVHFVGETELNGVETLILRGLSDGRCGFFPLHRSFWLEQHGMRSSSEPVPQLVGSKTEVQDGAVQDASDVSFLQVVDDTIRDLLERVSVVERENAAKAERLESIQMALQAQMVALQQSHDSLASSVSQAEVIPG